MFFSHFSPKWRFSKNVVKTIIFTVFFEGRALQTSQKKNYKQTLKQQWKFGVGKKRCQNGLKGGFGRVLGSIWEGVGTVWAVFWTLLGCFFGILNPNFCKHRSRMGSKRPFGSILDRFWGVLGGLWMDFERFWEGFGKIFYVRTPALSREAPRSVPMRGGPGPPSVLDDNHTNLSSKLPHQSPLGGASPF